MQNEYYISERTGFRDEEISRRHRLWGQLGFSDIDQMWIEQCGNIPVALFEYKSNWPNDISSSMGALTNLGILSCTPVFLTVYRDNFSVFYVSPLNKEATEAVPNKRTLFSEKEYVRFLYMLRGYEMPSGIFDERGHLIGENNQEEIIENSSMVDNKNLQHWKEILQMKRTFVQNERK